MEYIEFTIPGKPIAKKRPRFARRGKFVTTYSDQETEESKVMFHIMQGIKKYSDILPLPKKYAIEIECTFYMPIPKSTSKKRSMLMSENLIAHVKKPDIDNLLKFIKDCMNEIVYHDDSQITIVHAFKKYSDDPRTEISIFATEDMA